VKSNAMVVPRSKRASTAGQPRGQIIDGLSIRARPAEVEDRAIPGHWEGDLIAGSKNTHMATLVERQSRFTMLVKVPGKDTVSVVTALSRHVRTLPHALRRSLTWDRGMELAHHKRFTIATDVQVYFCDPQSPWQRGTNENTNRLLTPVLPERGRSVTLLSTRLEQDRVTVESTSAKDVGVSHASDYTGGSCCKHQLNLPPPFLKYLVPCGGVRFLGVTA
jgi:IS30 family transposase